MHGALIRIALLFLCFFVYPNFFLYISSLPNNYFCTTSFLYTATTMGKLASSTIRFFFCPSGQVVCAQLRDVMVRGISMDDLHLTGGMHVQTV